MPTKGQLLPLIQSSHECKEVLVLCSSLKGAAVAQGRTEGWIHRFRSQHRDVHFEYRKDGQKGKARDESECPEWSQQNA